MKNTDILYKQINKKPIYLNFQAQTEQGTEDKEQFLIVDIIGNFEQLKIRYFLYPSLKPFLVNPNQVL